MLQEAGVLLQKATDASIKNPHIKSLPKSISRNLINYSDNPWSKVFHYINFVKISGSMSMRLIQSVDCMYARYKLADGHGDCKNFPPINGIRGTCNKCLPVVMSPN